MLHDPQEAKHEQDFWTDIPEGDDMLPLSLPGEEAAALPVFNRSSPNQDGPYLPLAVTTPVGALDALLGDDEPDSPMQEEEADPLGSWTGVPKAEDEGPTQDADDL